MDTEFLLLSGQAFSDDRIIKGKATINGVAEDVEFEVPDLTLFQARKLKGILGKKISSVLQGFTKSFENIGSVNDIKEVGNKTKLNAQFMQSAAEAISEILLDEKVAEFLDENIVKRTVKMKVGNADAFIIGNTNPFDNPAYRKFESTIHAKILFQEGKVFMGGQ
jgi:hypothetical protein